MDRRQFLRPFVDRSLLPLPSSFASPLAWLGYFNAALAGGLVMFGCGKETPTSPTTATPPSTASPPSPQPAPVRKEPVSSVTASNGTTALLRHHGWSDHDDEPLLDAMRRTNLTLTLVKEGAFGEGTWQVEPTAFGWVFCVENSFFAKNASEIKLKKNDLWAAYAKQSLG